MFIAVEGPARPLRGARQKICQMKIEVELLIRIRAIITMVQSSRLERDAWTETGQIKGSEYYFPSRESFTGEVACPQIAEASLKLVAGSQQRH